MLPQTALAIELLKEVGIPRQKFKVVTPYSKTKQRYLTTRIIFSLSFRELQPYLEELSKRFQVIVTFFDQTPVSCRVLYSKTPGLYKLVNRQMVTASIEECTQAVLSQLSFF
jgi:hypothetical protein